jgi:hypothetical protein
MEYCQPFESENSKLETLFSTTTMQGKQRLEQIGNIICFDCFINNSDRIPVAWDNEGNRDNILITTNGAVIAIDQPTVTPPTTNSLSNTLVKAYQKRVAQILADFIPDQQSCPDFRSHLRDKDCITNSTGASASAIIDGNSEVCSVRGSCIGGDDSGCSNGSSSASTSENSIGESSGGSGANTNSSTVCPMEGVLEFLVPGYANAPDTTAAATTEAQALLRSGFLR